MWNELNFGKYKGKTLPQVLFNDPDWFFWAVEKKVFDNKPYAIKNQAKDILIKSQNIRIQKPNPKQWKTRYYTDHMTGKFANMEIVEHDRPAHVGSSLTSETKNIDLRMPRKISQYDKTGGKIIIGKLKYYFFGNSSARMTMKRCEDFFDNEDNFAI